jgi:hypothetical protein
MTFNNRMEKYTISPQRSNNVKKHPLREEHIKESRNTAIKTKT